MQDRFSAIRSSSDRARRPPWRRSPCASCWVGGRRPDRPSTRPRHSQLATGVKLERAVGCRSTDSPLRRRDGAVHAGRGSAIVFAAPRTQPRDRERTDDELSLGRGGDRPLAGRARGLRVDLRPPRGHPASLPGPPGGCQGRGGAGRRAVPDRVRAAQDVRRVARERAPVAVRDRLEPVAEAPARRGPAAARERPDGGSGRRRTDARAPRRSTRACCSRAWPTRSRRCRTREREALLLFAWEELSYQSVAEALELPIGTVRSRLNRARARLRELLEPNGKGRVRSR